MAHSYVSAFPREIDAFRAFAAVFPDRTTLLLDTYDTLAAARKAVTVARELQSRGHRLAAVRLDSGDIVALSRAVRRVLDEAGFPEVKIFVSGGLDEDAMEAFLEAGAPIDAFGVGTRMNVSADAPYLDMAYKIVRYGGRPVLKLSPGKVTWPGDKQVWRRRAAAGVFAGDVLALREEPEPVPGAEPLLRTVMVGGRRVEPSPPLSAIREYARSQLAALPEGVRRLRDPAPYPVDRSAALLALQRALETAVEAVEVAPERGVPDGEAERPGGRVPCRG
jgi:nicotinate phosphoribosyltransferase